MPDTLAFRLLPKLELLLELLAVCVWYECELVDDCDPPDWLAFENALLLYDVFVPVPFTLKLLSL